MKSEIFYSIQFVRYFMKMGHFILIVLFCLTSAFLFRHEVSFAEEPVSIEQGSYSDQAGPVQGGQLKSADEKQGKMLQGSAEPPEPGGELQQKGDSAGTEKQSALEKPLDLTFEPDFPNNPRWKGQFNTGRRRRYQDLFESSDKDKKLELKGEFLRSFEIEEEKFKSIDGAGIKIELNTE